MKDKKPTIAELEKILDEKGDCSIQLQPDGSIVANECETCKELRSKLAALDQLELTEKEVWGALAVARGCKPNQEDCTFQRCHSRAGCVLIVDAVKKAMEKKKGDSNVKR